MHAPQGSLLSRRPARELPRLGTDSREKRPIPAYGGKAAPLSAHPRLHTLPQLSLNNSNLPDTATVANHTPPRTCPPDHQTHHSCPTMVIFFVVGGRISTLATCPLLPCPGAPDTPSGKTTFKKRRGIFGALFSGDLGPVRFVAMLNVQLLQSLWGAVAHLL